MPWFIYTDGQGHYALAQAPSGAFITQHSGPYNTWKDGANAMHDLGVLGW